MRRWDKPAYDRRSPTVLYVAGRLQTEVPQYALVFAPLRLHADVEIQEHPRVEKTLQILPRRRSDALDHLAASSDHDRLVRLAVDDDRAVQLEQPAVTVGLFEAIDDHGARERN